MGCPALRAGNGVHCAEQRAMGGATALRRGQWEVHTALRRAGNEELKGAAKKLYKGLYETRESAAEQAVSRAKEAAKLAERAGYLARRAKGEEKPLDFLARFVAFKQHISEVHQISLQYSAEHGPGKKDLDQLVKEDAVAVRALLARRRMPTDTPRGQLVHLLAELVDRLSLEEDEQAPFDDEAALQALAGVLPSGKQASAPEQAEAAAAVLLPSAGNRSMSMQGGGKESRDFSLSSAWAEGERILQGLLTQFSKLQEGSSSGAAVPDVKNAVDACIHQASANKSKALLVGINYTGSDYALNGCINDVHHVKQLLTSQYGFGTSPDVLRILTDEPGSSGSPTCSNMREGLRWLVSDAVAGDQLFFHFSGHGTQARRPMSVAGAGRPVSEQARRPVSKCALPMSEWGVPMNEMARAHGVYVWRGGP
ncbi:hypothetical protein CYMTET_28531 [Cymbomonas tetramitiformis]|uniref:Peptidase C14 caspase domain-containing protein n=1 Tax=Cymbomonas tetramitiformis TaxID=36881 RepID=A0AAE0KVT4_9CHLO|nr:hypothetical protein CYMTET_28531 [Cymbomonas tetramitiformis]